MNLVPGNANPLPNLPGYIPLEPLYTSSRSLVYRAWDSAREQPVVIKILQPADLSFHKIVQWRNQSAVARNLDFPGILRPLSLEPWQKAYALIMPDNGSISLAQYARENPLNVSQVLNVALQMVEILHHLHNRRIIHKDIKPANILIRPDSQQIQLIDFSIASLLPKESQEILNPNVLEGTLAYIAPEQTGRMNRGIDYRADFYSLGATLYELLTHQLPFTADDPLELVHSHLAKSPLAPHHIDSTLPPLLSALVLKLMAKNAEDRYQSALGLKRDLEQCWEQWQETGRIDEFELGQQDWCDRFMLPEKLYGREAEIAQLLAAFDRVSGQQLLGGREEQPIPNPESLTPNSELMLVAGSSGIGKTAVINEIHKPIARQRGYFIKGKFDPFNRNIPLSAFVRAFRDLMVQLLCESDAQRQTWKSKILAALGSNGQVVIEVIPELEGLIGKQPSAPELSGTATRDRFNFLFQKFIEVFTQPEHPLVIFLDDLQWADSASLQFLKVLMDDIRYLLVLGAYRDNEVSATHPLRLTIDELQQAGKIVHTIALGALTFDETHQFVADTLHCPPNLAFSLAQTVALKTQGNPFYLTQLLKTLGEEGCITFDRERGYWQYDLSRVKQQALDLDEDAVEFIAAQLQKLPPKTQKMLELAACLGERFDLATLAIVADSCKSEIAINLWPALHQGFILPQNEIYKFYLNAEDEAASAPDLAEVTLYRFLHDSVQQAAYSLIPEERKAATHYRIGQRLLQKTAPEDREERIFELVNQLNCGIDLIGEQRERDELAALNAIAARKARTATAYRAGRNYGTVGLSLLGENAWQRQYHTALQLHDLTAELASLCGEFEELERLAQTIDRESHTPIERVNVCAIRIDARIARGQLSDAIAIGRQWLEQLGVTFPENPQPDDIQAAIDAVERLIGDRPIETLLDLPPMEDPEKIAILKIGKSLLTPAYRSNPLLYALISCLSIQLSLQSGNHPLTASAYVGYGLLTLTFVKEIERGFEFGQLASQLVLNLNAEKEKLDVLVATGGTIWHRKLHYKKALSHLKCAYFLSLRSGIFETAEYSIREIFTINFLCGELLFKQYKAIEDSILRLPTYSRTAIAKTGQSYQKEILKLLGDDDEEVIFFSKNDFQESDYVNSLLSEKHYLKLLVFYVNKILVFYLFGEYKEARNNAKEAYKYLLSGASTVLEAAFYFYDSLIALATLAPPNKENASDWERLNENQTQLQQYWAKYAPMNYQHKVDLIEAEKCRVLGQNYQAGDYYDRAIAGARDNEFLNEEALASELAAKFYLNWGKEKIASAYLQEANSAYTEWGAKAKVNALKQRYPSLLQPSLQQSNPPLHLEKNLLTLTPSQATLSTAKPSSMNLNNALDFVAVLKAARTISSTLELEKLLPQLTEIILQNAGGERCVLILVNREGELRVAAIAMAETSKRLSQTLEEYGEIPLKLIHYIKNTREEVVVNNLNTNLPIIDEYLQQQRPKSILGLPIVDRNQFLGIFYLENRAESRAFSSERIAVLSLLCEQAAVALKNARLYRHTQDQEQYLRSLYEGVDNPIFVVNVLEGNNFHWLGWNPTTERASNLKSSEVVGKTPEEIFGEEEGKLVRERLEDCLRSGGAIAYEETLTFQEQFTSWLTKLNPLRDENNRIYRIVGTAVEISELKRTEAALRESQSELMQKAVDLEEAMNNLKQAQLQIVQNEKMASLGNLVAGVAHEINNPIGFLNGSIKNVRDYVQDLWKHLELYQQYYCEPPPTIQDNAEAIDLEFLGKDFPKLIESMDSAIARIKSISNSLRIFSRADSENQVTVNLQEGIDSTLLILKYRLKANEHRPAIVVNKSYGKMLEIPCFPGQLNQVLMNILANAIDALDETAQKRSYAELESQPQQITIMTALKCDRAAVEIRIRDNGEGIPEELWEKIFEHLFTTKGVGKGTGLGLAIARQIIVEKHGGTLEVQSEVGVGTEFAIVLPIG